MSVEVLLGFVDEKFPDIHLKLSMQVPKHWPAALGYKS